MPPPCDCGPAPSRSSCTRPLLSFADAISLFGEASSTEEPFTQDRCLSSETPTSPRSQLLVFQASDSDSSRAFLSARATAAAATQLPAPKDNSPTQTRPLITSHIEST
ncbi:unnamed protein product [Pleuronectes platessa]|uniref:Uncharacterized protein n=1 Tax=Pleuronectes platessa TaxID=8262 RepID=A0A9N7YA78_PLEPL|nr:unnamed protein product [Pleuronectes platessa]